MTNILKNWKSKALIQNVLSRIPNGESIYFYLQKHYGGFKNFHVLSKVDQGINIIEVLHKANISIENKRTAEIGTGWVPIIPMVMYIFGQNSCFTYDNHNLLKPSLCVDAAKQLSELADHFQKELPWAWSQQTLNRLGLFAEANRSYQNLFEAMKLTYEAPVKIPFSNINSNSMDIISSNTTLEHIPITELRNILIASKRVLTSDGIMVHLVDCSDHFSHNDKSISRINFMRYSDLDWKMYNSKFIYQNRLRPSDYRLLLEETGFEIILWKPKLSEQLRSLLNTFPFAKEFLKYTVEDLITTDMEIVAKLRS